MVGAVLAANGSGDLIVGLVVGVGLGILVGPIVRSWQTFREWSEASREARLADRLMEDLELGSPRPDAEGGRSEEQGDVPVGAAWRTHP